MTRSFLLFGLAFILSTVVGIEASQLEDTRVLPAPGQDGMIELPGRTKSGVGYTYSSFATSFANAWEHCRSTGRNLLDIEDAAEQQEVRIIISSFGIDSSRIWTSGMEISPDDLVWASTFDPLGYNNIANSNPCQNDNCLTIINSGVNRFKWWHTNCALAYNFICEQK